MQRMNSSRNVLYKGVKEGDGYMAEDVKVMQEEKQDEAVQTASPGNGGGIVDHVGYDMSHVHRANLKILKEIDRICRKYKIQYALDAGTLIGAVRHKGFIPWDDDADIVFTRNQFEAFKKVVRREPPESWHKPVR